MHMFEKRCTTQHISVGGTPASGKSTNAKGVAAELGFTHRSGGDLMRSIGARRGLDILETNRAAASDPTFDQEVDAEIARIGTVERGVVIDSRMAWHFIPGSLRIFLHVPFDVAAERIIGNMTEDRRRTENIPDNLEEYAEQLAERQSLEEERYVATYDVNPFDLKNYDLVIQTNGAISVAAAQLIVVEAFRDLHKTSN